MAFFRFNRDKRGYEHFFLVEPVTNRRGKTRPRVLYWYRTPPNVRVGRVPFDEEAQRALEAQNPNVTFDWRKIIDAPIPSADVERWRERRRAEKAEKAEKAARHHAPTASDLDEPVSDTVDHDAEADQIQRTPLAATAPPTSGGAEQQRKRRRRRRGRGPRPDAIASQVSAAAEPAPPPDEASGD